MSNASLPGALPGGMKNTVLWGLEAHTHSFKYIISWLSLVSHTL